MSEIEIRQYAKDKGFHPQTLERWLRWDQFARDTLFRLAVGLKLGENHLRDLMDWLEEIALRDRSTIGEILASKPITDIESDPRLGRADRLKRVKEELRRLRFPRLAQLEGSIRARIQELKLHPEIRLTVPLGLEGGRLRVELSASTLEDLKRQTGKLAEAADTNTVREIFALLTGEAVESRPKSDHFFPG
ncbi:MAG: hypothetical protein ABWZ17_07945 [Candidatus Binatia bacterium]